MAVGIVRVRPGSDPAKVIVAPNSPSARENASSAAAAMPDAAEGIAIRKKSTPSLAPSALAASIKSRGTSRNAPSAMMTTTGSATKSCAKITATKVNGIEKPKKLKSAPPNNPRRPQATNKSTPPTTGGSTSGIARTGRSFPHLLLVAIKNASGRPTMSEMTNERIEVRRVS